jgi:hypothetical protein
MAGSSVIIMYFWLMIAALNCLGSKYNRNRWQLYYSLNVNTLISSYCDLYLMIIYPLGIVLSISTIFNCSLLINYCILDANTDSNISSTVYLLWIVNVIISDDIYYYSHLLSALLDVYNTFWLVLLIRVFNDLTTNSMDAMRYSICMSSYIRYASLCMLLNVGELNWSCRSSNNSVILWLSSTAIVSVVYI